MSEWPNKPLEINDNDLENIINKYENVVIDCWAPWCAPCLMLSPLIKDLAKGLQGKVVFAKINVDNNPRTAMAFNIMSIPTLLIFKNGQLKDKIIGAILQKDLLKNKLLSALQD
ncbi:MAG: thioredoxin [Thermoplasmata archaeon]|nr:MAG: thioredoxin [Thermoplasmata archaeon]